MKLLLTSAGLVNDEIKLALAELVGKSLEEIEVVFVITAGNTGFDDRRWLLENLNQFDHGLTIQRCVVKAIANLMRIMGRED